MYQFVFRQHGVDTGIQYESLKMWPIPNIWGAMSQHQEADTRCLETPKNYYIIHYLTILSRVPLLCDEYV